jgi:hypothetical protein
MNRRSSDCRRQRWGPGARGRREEGEGHGHLARRASCVALAKRGEMVAAAIILGEAAALRLARVDRR